VADKTKQQSDRIAAPETGAGSSVSDRIALRDREASRVFALGTDLH